MGNAFEIRHLPGEDLASPDCPVITVTNPIDRNADAGFGGCRCDMRTVVLYRDEFKPVVRCYLAGEPGGEELGVQVMSNHIELCPEKSLQVPHRFLQVFKCRRIAYISYMGGRDRKPVFVDCCIRVQFRAYPENAVLPEIYCCPLRGNPPGEP